MAKFDAKVLAKYGFLGGRPKSFKNPKDMRNKMAEFLTACNSRTKTYIDKSGVERRIDDPAPVTLEDFCCFAGITKTTFYEYGKKKEYKELVDAFTQAVEAYWVRQCAEGNAGNKADFVLKNSFAGQWKDNKEVTINPVSNVNFKVIDGTDLGD